MLLMLDIPALPEMLLEQSYVEFSSEMQQSVMVRFLTCYAVEAPFELLGTSVKPWCPNDCHETQQIS